jgi:hypothetical protein
LQPLAGADQSQTKFTINADISGVNAKALLVDIRHEGFTSFSRRTPIESSIYLQANLATLTESIVMPTQAVSISGATTNGFTLEAKDSTDGKPSMSISIPASSLPTGTGSLTAAIKTYDPNDPEDAQYFPGSYADSTGNGLVSVAFNYADVKTNTGESLQSIARNDRILRQKPGALAFLDPPEPVIINRDIPTSSCSTLEKLGDANTELAGFQIPVYTYNPKSGLWDLLGYGSVFTDSGVVVPADTKNFNCSVNNYVLEIKVTNEIFLSDWWNLDYPLQFTLPKKRCANVHIVNEANEPLSGVYGLISGNSEFSSQYFVSDENGNADVSVDVFSDDVTVANFSIWGNGGAYGTFNLSSTCPAAAQTIVIKRPQLCKIKGHVQYSSGKNVRNIGIYAFRENNIFVEYFYAFTTTDNDGNYTLDVACNNPYTVQTIFWKKEDFTGVNVNGKSEPNELSDDGKQVTLTSVVFATPPFETTFLTGYDAELKEGLVVFYGMYDAFPISYDLQLKNTVTGEVVANAQGTLEFDTSLSEYDSVGWFLRTGQIKVPVALPSDLTNYSVVGSYTDGFGIKATVTRPVGLNEDEQSDLED